jgi:predicted DNA-binding transcriptional regulator AlpA
MVQKRILRTPDAAEYLGLSSSTLEKKRLDGSGPPFVRLGGRAVGYDVGTLNCWLEQQERTSTSDRGKPSRSEEDP